MSMFQPNEPTPDLLAPKTKRGKKFEDSELNQLAIDANRYIRWPGIENEDDPINAMITAKCRTASTCNVYPIGGGFSSNKYVVKLTICGKQYRINISNQRLRLCRYADAAILYFWKYKATTRPPDDSDFNTSLVVARELLAVPACATQLRNLEKWLIDCGAIQTAADKAAEQRVHDFVRDMRVARKYLERSRRYTRLLGERYVLNQSKSNAVVMVVANITASLEIFSSMIQADAQSVIQAIRQESITADAAPTKSAEDILFEQAAERARIAREQH